MSFTRSTAIARTTVRLVAKDPGATIVMIVMPARLHRVPQAFARRAVRAPGYRARRGPGRRSRPCGVVCVPVPPDGVHALLQGAFLGHLAAAARVGRHGDRDGGGQGRPAGARRSSRRWSSCCSRVPGVRLPRHGLARGPRALAARASLTVVALACSRSPLFHTLDQAMIFGNMGGMVDGGLRRSARAHLDAARLGAGGRPRTRPPTGASGHAVREPRRRRGG